MRDPCERPKLISQDRQGERQLGGERGEERASGHRKLMVHSGRMERILSDSQGHGLGDTGLTWGDRRVKERKD